MTLQQLRYFFGVVRWKSFTAAAEALFLSQPALSKQMAQLEKHLGFTLFERSQIGVTLTEKGQLFYGKMYPLYNEMGRVLDELREPTELRVGSLPSIGTCLLPEISARLLPVKIHSVNKHTTLELLDLAERGELDAVFVQDRETFGALHGLFLLEEPYMVALPAGHPLAAKEALTLDEVMAEPMVMHQAPCDIHDTLLDEFQRLGCNPRIAMKSPHESILSYTAMGVGLSFIPEMSTKFVTHKDIVYRPIEGTPLFREIRVFTRSEKVREMIKGSISFN